MKTKKIFNHIRELINQDKLFEAIRLINTLLQNSPKLDDVILQNAQLNRISSEIRMGTIDYKESDIVKNKIVTSLLHLIRDIENHAEINEEIKKEVKSFSKSEPQFQISLTHKGKGDIILGDKNIIKK